MDGIYRCSCRGALRGAWVRCMRNSGTFLGTLLVSKEYRCAGSSVSRRTARSYLTKMEPVRTSGTLPLCPCISCEAKETLTASTASPKAQRLPSPKAQHLPSPAHVGRRANGCAREAVKANALLFAFARTE